MKRIAHAIILRRVAYGDADWIVTFLDREEGRKSGIAKSARASLKRFGGALGPGTVVELSSSAPRWAGLVVLTEARVVQSAIGAMKSLGRIQALARALELALAFLREGQPVPEKYELLRQRLAAISAAEPPVAGTVLFEIEWLKRCGFGPQLSGCLLCGEAAAGKRWSFDFDRGGVVCGGCTVGVGQRMLLTGGALDGLQRLDGQEPLEEGSGALAAGAVVARYIDHILGRPLKIWTI